jgi:hypothetical protein
MFVGAPAIFRATIRQNTQDRQVVLLLARQPAVIEQAGGGDPLPGRACLQAREGAFCDAELDVGHLAVSAHTGLLLVAPNALEGAGMERVLAAGTARAGGFDLTAGSVSSVFFSSACTCASVRIPPSAATKASSAFSRVLIPPGTWLGNALPGNGWPDPVVTRSTAHRRVRQTPPACAPRLRCGPGHMPENPWRI